MPMPRNPCLKPERRTETCSGPSLPGRTGSIFLKHVLAAKHYNQWRIQIGTSGANNRTTAVKKLLPTMLYRPVFSGRATEVSACPRSRAGTASIISVPSDTISRGSWHMRAQLHAQNGKHERPPRHVPTRQTTTPPSRRGRPPQPGRDATSITPRRSGSPGPSCGIGRMKTHALSVAICVRNLCHVRSSTISEKS